MGESVPAAIYRFERIEKKFWMSTGQYKALLPTLERHLNYDSFGESTVCSIYYDTPDFSMIRRSIERPRFKEKLRVRSYGVPGDGDMVFVEIKRKLDGVGYKRRISVPFAQAKKLLRGEAIHCDNPQIEREIAELVRRYAPQPAVCMTYRRFAMYGKEDPEFRVTIDRDLNYTTENPEKPGVGRMEPIMEDHSRVLMEIKALDAIPRWLTDELSRLNIYQAPFSKIGTCYTRHIAGKSISSHYGKER